MLFINKGIEFIDLRGIFKTESVISLFLLLFKILSAVLEYKYKSLFEVPYITSRNKLPVLILGFISLIHETAKTQYTVFNLPDMILLGM